MHGTPSDALVFFGATGDLAYKKIFPALQRMVRHGNLDVPLIGVSRGGFDLERLRERARESLEAHGGVDPDAFHVLCSRLRYVDGDYADPGTFARLRRELGTAAHPTHYLAIPPSLLLRAPVSMKPSKPGACATKSKRSNKIKPR